MTTPSNALAGALIALSLVCATVLAGLHVLSADVVGHVLSAALGGGLAYLTPSTKLSSP